MKDDHDKSFVLSFLRNGGFQVNPIPELSNHKTPDLSIALPERGVLVEVKSKEDDQQLRGLLKSPKGTSLSYNVSVIETVLRNGYRQLRDFPDRDDSDFTLIWFIARKIGGVTILVGPAVMPILYGIESLEGKTVDGNFFGPTSCYFFYESFFFKRKDLDGIVLHDDRSVQLCLNPFSPRHNTFNSTKVAAFFREFYSVVNPRQLEAARKCFIADCKGSRQDTNGIVRYLKSKYGIGRITINRFSYVNCPVD
ncbi:MAG: hypothetical protein GWP10_11530 [Nitrospiraceae bacterium]|nr:hypothetical protein [Nitrospiraceae bacterium]